jgi:hypothetical protein
VVGGVYFLTAILSLRKEFKRVLKKGEVRELFIKAPFYVYLSLQSKKYTLKLNKKNLVGEPQSVYL